jgi:thiol-disulfide isomerase/thioredoxin
VAPDAAPYEVVLEDLSGNNVELPIGEGKPVVLSMMQSWCGPCLAELHQWADSLIMKSDPPFRVVAVTDEAPEIALKLSWRWQEVQAITLLRSRTSFKEVGIMAFPTNYIFNHRGQVVWKQVGPLNLADRELRNHLRLN